MTQKYNIKILFNATTDNQQDVQNFLASLKNNYPELEDVESEELEYHKGDFHTLVSCTMPTTESIDDIIRLTHHAEALYEDTHFEYVHVEVCVDGTWYGR